MSNPIAMMVDIETLSRLPSAYVAQIGYCVANLDTGELLDEGTIDLTHEGQESRHQEDETIQWWISQDKAVFQAVFQGENRISKDDAFQFLKGVVEKHGVDSVWAKQASFDFAILSDLWEGKRPWNFRAESEMRVMNRYMDPDGSLAKSMEANRARMAHHAGDDARFQMEVLITLHQRLTKMLKLQEREAQAQTLISQEPKSTPHSRTASSARAAEPSGSLMDAYALWDRLQDVSMKDDRLVAALDGFPSGTHKLDIWQWLESQCPNFSTDDVMAGIRIESLEIQESTCEKFVKTVLASPDMRERYAQLLARQPGESEASHIERCVRADIADGEDVTLFPDEANRARHDAEIELLDRARQTRAELTSLSPSVSPAAYGPKP